MVGDSMARSKSSVLDSASYTVILHSMGGGAGVSGEAASAVRKSKGKEKVRSDGKKAKKSKKSAKRQAEGGVVRSGHAAVTSSSSAPSTDGDGLSSAFGLLTESEKLVLVRVPAGLDPSELDGKQISLEKVCDLPGPDAEQLQSYPEAVRSASAGAGRPVVLSRSASGQPIRVVGAFDYRLTITESLRLAGTEVSPQFADAAANGIRVKQLDNLEFRYVPFGSGGAAAAPVATPMPSEASLARKRKRREAGQSKDPSKKKKKKKSKKA